MTTMFIAKLRKGCTALNRPQDWCMKLKLHLAKYGYKPDPIATNIWTHTSRRTKFCLCVDDFGVQYFNDQDADHLIQALRDKYEITIDKTGQKFCGLHLDWDYTNGWVDISMPKYVQTTLKKLNYKPTKKNQYPPPHKWNVPIYGSNKQFATPNDMSPTIDKTGIKYVQRVVGSEQ